MLAAKLLRRWLWVSFESHRLMIIVYETHLHVFCLWGNLNLVNSLICVFKHNPLWSFFLYVCTFVWLFFPAGQQVCLSTLSAWNKSGSVSQFCMSACLDQIHQNREQVHQVCPVSKTPPNDWQEVQPCLVQIWRRMPKWPSHTHVSWSIFYWGVQVILVNFGTYHMMCLAGVCIQLLVNMSHDLLDQWKMQKLSFKSSILNMLLYT